MSNANQSSNHIRTSSSSSDNNPSKPYKETYIGPRDGNPFVRKCNICISIFKWVPVIFISSVLTWGYYAYVIQLCWFNMEPVILKISCLSMFHFLYIMTFWSYFATIFTEAGTIPKSFWFTVRDSERFHGQEERRNQIIQQIASEKNVPIANLDSTGAVRICDKCNIFKPDRAHHCSACNKCVLKMDHHCPWVNNCVSFTNYKYFVLFLGYSFFLCLFTAASSFPFFLQFWRNQLTSESKFHVLFLFFVSIMFAISLVSLFGYHIYLLTMNRSTVESFRPPIFRSGPDRNAYNLGKVQNWIQIFGENKWKWFLPVYTSLGDGIVYSTRKSATNDSEYGLVQCKTRGLLLNESSPQSLNIGGHHLGTGDQDNSTSLSIVPSHLKISNQSGVNFYALPKVPTNDLQQEQENDDVSRTIKNESNADLFCV